MKQKDIDSLNRKIGGSQSIKAGRAYAINHVFQTLRELNKHVSTLDAIKAKHVQDYVKSQLAKEVSPRTLQNRVSAVRMMLTAAGMGDLARSEYLSCKTLGISGASRAGTHRVLAPDAYGVVLAKAQARDPVFAALVVMQRELGLRAREAVRCGKSLESWKRSLERGMPIKVVLGTKGARPRDSHPVSRERALEAVKTALNAFKTHSTGNVTASKTLEGAMRAYGRDCAAVGLSKENASHCLRYQYARDRFEHHFERIGDRQQALVATSLELGHGDGRGAYIAQVYLR
jgi:Integrase/Phage integrase, N-terminal